MRVALCALCVALLLALLAFSGILIVGKLRVALRVALLRVVRS